MGKNQFTFTLSEIIKPNLSCIILKNLSENLTIDFFPFNLQNEKKNIGIFLTKTNLS